MGAPRPEGLIDDQTIEVKARGAFDLGQVPGPKDADGKIKEKTDVKVIVDGSLKHGGDQGTDNDDAIYPYDAATRQSGPPDLLEAETTNFSGGVELLFTRMKLNDQKEFDQPPSRRDFLLGDDHDDHKEPTVGIRLGLDVNRQEYGGPYRIRGESDSSICSQPMGTDGLYTEAEATGSTFGRAREAREQCRLSGEDVVLSLSVRGDVIDLISPKFRLGQSGELSVIPGISLETYVAGPNKGRTDLLVSASIAVGKVSGKPKKEPTSEALDHFDNLNNQLTKLPQEKFKKAIEEIQKALDESDLTIAKTLYDKSASKTYKEASDYFDYVTREVDDMLYRMEEIVEEELDFDMEKMAIHKELRDKFTVGTLFVEASALKTEADQKMRELETKLLIPEADRLAR